MTKLSSIRLTSYSQIDQIIKTGTVFKSSWCKFTYLPSDKFTLTISISKKISKKAVVRNLIKRRIKHSVLSALKDNYSNLPIVSPINLLILVYPSAKETDYQSIKNDVSKFISNIQSQIPKPSVHESLSQRNNLNIKIKE